MNTFTNSNLKFRTFAFCFLIFAFCLSVTGLAQSKSEQGTYAIRNARIVTVTDDEIAAPHRIGESSEQCDSEQHAAHHRHRPSWCSVVHFGTTILSPGCRRRLTAR